MVCHYQKTSFGELCLVFFFLIFTSTTTTTHTHFPLFDTIAQGSDMPHPELLVSSSIPPLRSPLHLTWKTDKVSQFLTLSEEDTTVQYTSNDAAAWVPIQSKERLHSGRFLLKFDIQNIGDGQIGVGFLLDWNVGVDWGFFGYLGSSSTGWSYDPKTGDIVSSTESISGGHPKFDAENGTVAVEFNLPRDKDGTATFIVKGERIAPVELSKGAVVAPAACLFRKGQKVSMKLDVLELFS
eukprot:TRINITY_DN934_c0_g1_i1.p1 TRINITY_DN934_c0_g1~~TRINITY_DN934_c0_g1_i1.p1  ORF type:complete len:239 (+),score=55.69 TRINITY_DN934_c0_g1_i1:154-870(+)